MYEFTLKILSDEILAIDCEDATMETFTNEVHYRRKAKSEKDAILSAIREINHEGYAVRMRSR